MIRIRTSPTDIIRWIGFGPLSRSDNLRMPSPEKARLARILWESVERRRIATSLWIDGGDDAA